MFVHHSDKFVIDDLTVHIFTLEQIKQKQDTDNLLKQNFCIRLVHYKNNINYFMCEISKRIQMCLNDPQIWHFIF